MMQEVKKLLSYDKSGCWAVLSKGPDVVVNGHSTTMLPTLDDYDMWKEHVTEKGFDRSVISNDTQIKTLYSFVFNFWSIFLVWIVPHY